MAGLVVFGFSLAIRTRVDFICLLEARSVFGRDVSSSTHSVPTVRVLLVTCSTLEDFVRREVGVVSVDRS